MKVDQTDRVRLVNDRRSDRRIHALVEGGCFLGKISNNI